jgi:hypothetical protein
VSRAAALESAQQLEAPGDTDAVTFAWADPAAELYGMARLGRGAADDGSLESSTLCVVFAGHAPVGVFARGGESLPDAGWDGLQLPGLATAIEVPLERWALSGGGDAPFSLEFQATAQPAELPATSPVTQAGGLAGYTQLCRVRGTVRIDGRERRLDGVGQRSHMWGNRPWERIALTRSLGIWFADGTGVLFGSVRPTGSQAHADETSGASLVGPGGDVVAHAARLSTTSDGDGRQLRAGLELYMAEDAPPHQAAGETLCGATLDLGPARLDCAFLRWHMEGREGIGRYDVLRRT